MNKSVAKTKSMVIEVTHLYDNRNNKLLTERDRKNIESNGDKCLVDIIGRRLAARLAGDNVVVDTDEDDNALTNIAINKSADVKNYYEENQLFRYSGSLTIGGYVDKIRDLVKKSWIRLCDNEYFANSLVSVELNSLQYMADIDRLISRQQYSHISGNGVKSFSMGSIIDLTHFVEHYSSRADSECGLNVAKDDMIADFQYDRNQLVLRFRVTSGGHNGKLTRNIRYKCEYEFKAFNSAVVSFGTLADNPRIQTMKIYFLLSHPPILYKHSFDDMTPEEQMRFNQSYTRGQVFRKRKIYKTIESDKGVHNYEVQNHHPYIRDNEFYGCNAQTIGKSTVLMIEIPLIVDPKKLKEKSRELPDPYRILYLMKRFARIPIYFSHIETHDCVNKSVIQMKNELHIEYPFPIEYAFLSVFSHTFKSSDELFLKNQTKEFITKVKEYSIEEQNHKPLEETLFELSALADRNAIYYTMNAFENIFNDYKTMNEKMQSIDIKSFNVEIENIRRCILTPTRFLILPPQPTLRSRFIADNDSEYTIRLSVREDDLQSLQFSVRTHNDTQNKFLKRMIKDPIMKGITLSKRKYEFLGSSSSQLKDAGMILYAKDSEGRTADSIRESIGDFSKTNIRKNVAKYVARLGLAFSQVMTHIDVKQSETEVIADIKSETKKLDENGETTEEFYTFSDGIGKVSLDIMEEVYKKLKNDCLLRPSAMQIRYGGCKGMLVVDPNLKGRQIQFRESMEKYGSDAAQLGIIKLSAPRPLYLNRPLITILEHLKGKGDESTDIFQQMLMNDLKGLSNAMICECAATKLLQNSSTLGIPYRKLYKSGIPFLSEPIFRQIIESIINYRINELKMKARIKVPMSCGRTVFGVMDETGTLEYGQVFVQLSEVDENNIPLLPEESDDEYKTFILKDEIMVTKFPCLHPGDVRKFTAVDVKALHHIKDCIVFPQKGKRPHPDEMAGSDLDGDEYAVIWDSDLIFDKPNEKAMNFPVSEPKLLEKDAQVADILDFYCEYIVGNTVGLLASAHLAKADLSDKSIDDDICMSLAIKYAIALDFAKTGRLEPMQWNERPKLYPDFMQKFSTKRTYLSKKMLGQLYRHCDRYSHGLDTGKDLEIKAEPIPCLIIDGWEKYKESALNAYEDYKRKVICLLNTFGVESEAKLLSGAFSKASKYMNGRTETNDVHELLENMINKLFIEFKERFKNECQTQETEENYDKFVAESERKLRASAWYMTPFKLEEDIKERYFGFSWTITEEVCKLMENNTTFNVNRVNHKCNDMGVQLLHDFFERNYLYREPVIDSSVTDESDRRQIIMEERFKTADVVLRAWLERQDHLFFKRKIGRKLISSTDAVLSDMDRKLRRELQNRKVQLLFEARNTTKPLKSAAELVMNFLTESVNEWLDIKTIDLNNRVVDTPLVKIGFSALITLNHFFKTREISHIIYLGKRFKISLKTPIREATFYIPLPRTDSPNTGADFPNKAKMRERDRKYVEYMVQYPELFCEQLRRMSGALEIVLEPYPLNKKQLEHFYLLTATGTMWSLQTIKSFVCHKQFFQTVSNGDKQWKRKNLYLKGKENKQNKENKQSN